MLQFDRWIPPVTLPHICVFKSLNIKLCLQASLLLLNTLQTQLHFSQSFNLNNMDSEGLSAVTNKKNRYNKGNMKWRS